MFAVSPCPFKFSDTSTRLLSHKVTTSATTYRNPISTWHGLDPLRRHKAGRIRVVHGAVLIVDILPARIFVFRDVEAGTAASSAVQCLGSKPCLRHQWKSQDQCEEFCHREWLIAFIREGGSVMAPVAPVNNVTRVEKSWC